MLISTVIIALNEEDQIGQCIESALPVSDEVIVIDSGSTDGTIDIAKSLGAAVEETLWLGYGLTKNLGHTLVKNDWILSLDCDEYLSPTLQDEIIELNLQERNIYQINRQNIYEGQAIKHSGWSPDWVDRLFHKEHSMWNDNLVHERLISVNCQRTKLSNVLMHESYKSEADHLQKIEKYAKLKAETWIKNGKTPGFIKSNFGPWLKWATTYYIKKGYLDGDAGKKIAKMNAHLVKRQLEIYKELTV